MWPGGADLHTSCSLSLSSDLVSSRQLALRLSVRSLKFGAMGDLKKFACVWLAIGVFFVTGQRTFLDSPGNIALFRAIRKWTGDVIGACSDYICLYILFFQINVLLTPWQLHALASLNATHSFIPNE